MYLRYYNEVQSWSSKWLSYWRVTFEYRTDACTTHRFDSVERWRLDRQLVLKRDHLEEDRVLISPKANIETSIVYSEVKVRYTFKIHMIFYISKDTIDCMSRDNNNDYIPWHVRLPKILQSKDGQWKGRMRNAIKRRRAAKPAEHPRFGRGWAPVTIEGGGSRGLI